MVLIHERLRFAPLIPLPVTNLPKRASSVILGSTDTKPLTCHLKFHIAVAVGHTKSNTPVSRAAAFLDVKKTIFLSIYASI